MSFFSYFKNIFCFENKRSFSVEEQVQEYLNKEQRQVVEEIKEIFSEKDNFVLFVHKNADPDSLCSAIVLASVLKGLGKKARVVALERINSQSKKIISHYPYPVSYDYDFNNEESDDVYLILDAPDFSSIRPDIKIPEHKKIIIIDHHNPSKKKYKSEVKFIDSNASSTAVLVYMLVKFIDYRITREIAVFLLLGIVADTGFLKRTNNIDFIALFELTQYECINNISTLLKKEKDMNERLENLKALSRLKIYQFGDDLLVGYTYAGSYGASIALSHMYAGCDVIFVETRGKNNMSLSARSRRHLENRLNLATLIHNIARKYRDYNGTGGGHRTAASMQLMVSNKISINLEGQIIHSLEKSLDKKSKVIKI